MATTAVSNVAQPCPRLSKLHPHNNTNPKILSSHSYYSFKNNVALSKSHGTLLRTTHNSRSRSAVRATIALGEKLPEATLTFLDKNGELGKISMSELTSGEKLTLVAIPCSFIDTFKARDIEECHAYAAGLVNQGIDVAIVAVNGDWGIDHKELRFFNDEKGEFAKAMGFPAEFISGDFTVNKQFRDGYLQRKPWPYSIQVCAFKGIVQGFEFERLQQTPVAVGEKIPDATLTYLDKEGELGKISISELTTGKKLTLVLIPCSFIETFKTRDLPKCEEFAEGLKSRGVDVAIVAVNGKWGMKDSDKLRLLNDEQGDFAKQMDFPVDFITGNFALKEYFGSDFLEPDPLPYSIQVYVEDAVVQGFDFERLERSRDLTMEKVNEAKDIFDAWKILDMSSSGLN